MADGETPSEDTCATASLVNTNERSRKTGRWYMSDDALWLSSLFIISSSSSINNEKQHQPSQRAIAAIINERSIRQRNQAMLYDPFAPITTPHPAATLSPTSTEIDTDIPMPTPIPSKPVPARTAPPQQPIYAEYTDYGEIGFDDPISYDTVNRLARCTSRGSATTPIPVRTAPAYQPIYTEYTDYGEVSFPDPVEYDAATLSAKPKAMPRCEATEGAPIPVYTAEPVYEDYTDYGELFLPEPFQDDYDFDSAATLDGMLKLERVPNHRRDSGYESPSSPLEKLQREEVLADEAIPAIWTQEQMPQRCSGATNGRGRRRRSSLVLAPPLCASEEGNDDELVRSPSVKASLSHTPDHDDPWPLWMEAGTCATCKAALKWKCLTERHAPREECGCDRRRRVRRDACGEEQALARMRRFVEEHLSWPVGLS